MNDFIVPEALINLDLTIALLFVSSSIQVLLLICASNDFWILALMFRTSSMISSVPSNPFSLT